MTVRWMAAGLAIALGGASPAADVPTGRLPSTVVPLAYRLDLREDPAQPRFTGHVEIDVRLAAPARSLFINGRDLDVSHVHVRAGGRTVAATYTQLPGSGVARLDAASRIPAGRATLVLDYGREFRTGSRGLYRLQAAGRWYSYTQFQPIEARTAFPSFDEPGFKTPFTISLTLPQGLTAVSNAAEVSAVPTADGWVVHRFAPTLPLPTYLVAFMAGPFATVSGAVGPNAARAKPLPVRIVATGGQADKLAFALKETAPILSLLEDYFGDAFPFPKLDQIATPAWPGATAMENAGADTYGERVLLLGRAPSVAQQRSFGMVVAHELSHQWFGDLVTPAWWDDIWLNESFANWMGYRIGNAWRPELKIGSGAVADALRAMDLDALIAGRPIHQPIASAEDAERAFDEVTYSKGGQVVTQTAAYLGDARFRDGVRLHLARRRYGSATSEQFFAALSDAAHDPRVTASMKSFVDQPGVPLLTFARAGDGWTATQSRYAFLGETPPRQTWVVPLCVRPLDGARRCVLADRATTPLSGLGAGPFVPNAAGEGYYRFDLPEADWPALIARMDALPAAEALAVNDSLWASFAGGRASPALLVRAAGTLAANPDGIAVLDGAARLRSWRTRGLIAADDLPAYRRLIALIYGSRLTALGMDVRAGAYADEDPDRRSLREGLAGIMAEEARDAATRAQLAVAAEAYLAGDMGALGEGFLPVALTVHLEEHDLATSVRLLARAGTSDDAVFRSAAIEAVGGGAPVATARDVVALVFEPALSERTRGQLAGALLARPETRAAAEAAILPRLGALGRSIPSVSMYGDTGSFDQACSAEEAVAVEAGLRSHLPNLRGDALALDRMVERIRTCGVLKSTRGGEIVRALSAPEQPLVAVPS